MSLKVERSSVRGTVSRGTDVLTVVQQFTEVVWLMTGHHRATIGEVLRIVVGLSNSKWNIAKSADTF